VIDEMPIAKMKKEEKKLSQYKQHKPEQLTLFEMGLPKDQRYSNTLDLYDFMPKYVWGKVRRINDKFLDSIEREFEYRQVRYKIKIRPASLEDKKGRERYCFPAKREEIVEEALRKLIVGGQGIFLDGDLAVVFTLYQLQQELKRNGHTYSTAELKDSIRILNDTKITLLTEGGEEIGFHPIDTYGFAGEDGEEKTFVKFSTLVKNTIKNGRFRLYNYETVLSYRSVIARQLHKRFGHHHVTASITKPFNIKLSTLIRDFGLTRYEKLSHNIRDVELALQEMKEKEVVLFYKTEKIFDARKNNKLTDAKFTLTPSIKFESEIILANKRQKDRRETVEKL
jgi:hypothetical protein